MDRLKAGKWQIITFLFAVLTLWSCSSKEACSSHLECKDGFYCGDNRKCAEFKADDYKISFSGIEDGKVFTTADDIDRSTGDIEINITVLVEDAKDHVRDGMDATLSIKPKTGATNFITGKILDGKIVFTNVKMPEGQVTIESWLTKNPALKASVQVSVHKMEINAFYLKGGKDGVPALLDGAGITDYDDYENEVEEGLAIYITAETEGVDPGEKVLIIIPELKADPVAEAETDEDGKVVFGPVDIPVWKNVRMSLVSGVYSKSISFTVDSSKTCGFMLNLKNEQILGIADDKNLNLSGLQYDLKISEITGCGKGSKVSIYIGGDSEEEIELSKTLYIAGSSVEERITISASSTAGDLKKVKIVIEDEELEIFGQRTVAGLTVDLDPPFGEITSPEYDQVLTLSDDDDPEVSGLQTSFSGTAGDIVTPPVTVALKLQGVTIATETGIDGDFSVPYTFSQSLQNAVLEALITDGAGNRFVATQIFSVSIDSGLEFYSVCGKTGGQIINGMWLNASDDEDPLTDGLKCTVIFKTADSSGVDTISLSVGDGDPQSKDTDENGEVSFEIVLSDDSSGIPLTAKAYAGDNETGEVVLSVRVDTEIPVTNITNNLLLNSGESTSSPDITFNFGCNESLCTYNSQLNSETTDMFYGESSRVVTGLADGSHTIRVRVRDAAGNTSEPVVFNWTVDTENPETTITKDPGPGTTANFALFEFVSSKEPFKFYCRLEKDDADLIPADGTWEECNGGKRDYYGLGEGTYRFRVYAQDVLGNIDPSPAEHIWIMGSSAPVTTITSVDPDDYATSSTSVEFEYEATVESTFECRLEKDGVVVESWVDCSLKTKAYSSLEDGVYLFSVRATALYGVAENTPVSYSWVVDSTPPKVKFTSKPAQASPYDTGTFMFECVDETSCVMECRLDEEASVDCSSGIYNYENLAGGTHRFTVVATDDAGNVSVTVSDPVDQYLNDYTWNIDDSVLGVQITVKPPVHSGSADALFEFSSNKMASFECSIDGGDFTSCASPQSYSGLGEGSHTFTVKAIFGPDEVSENYIWNVDTVAPVVNINTYPDNPTFQTGATFNFSANESSTFECSIDGMSAWTVCTSPRIYPSGTFGIMGTEQSYTFRVRATDLSGNTGEASYTWTVDLDGPAIDWISPAPGTDGKVVVGKSHDVFAADPNIYAINVVLKISGSDPGQPINVTGFKTPPGYNIVSVDSSSPKNYTLTIGLEQGARINNPLTITVQDDSGSVATLNQLVIVNTEQPTITWAYPANNHKFISSTTAPQFIFNVWNAIPGSDVELVDSDTGEVIGVKKTVGSTSGFQENVTFNPSMEDRCAPYNLHARFYDELEEIWHYTNAVSAEILKSSRAVFVDRNRAVIGDITIPGITDVDRVLNRDKNLNSDPDGGLLTSVAVNITDPDNSYGDSNRSVRLFTNNGIGEASSILLATLHGQGDFAQFENVALQEGSHLLRIEVADCGGNLVSKTIPAVTVDTVIPELSLISPKGSSSNWRWIVAADDPVLGTINASGDFTGVQMEIVSNETLSGVEEVFHTVRDYSNTIISQNDITSNAVLDPDGVTVRISLPDLVYGKHRFEVTVSDLAGNDSKIGHRSHEIYEVDVIVPQISIVNINEDDSFDAVPIPVEMSVADVAPESIYTLTAYPVDSGGNPDPSRSVRVWTGKVVSDGTVMRNITAGDGLWELVVYITDDHGNRSEEERVNISIGTDAPSIALKKGYGYSIGAGPVLNGFSEEHPAWLMPSDVYSCLGDFCSTDLDVMTDAPSGSTVELIVNSAGAGSVLTSGQYASFAGIDFDTTDVNLLEVKVINVDTLAEGFETYYIMIDGTVPTLSLINPVDCSAQEVCRRRDMTDNPATPDYIELAELGYGYDDDAIPGGALNFRPSGKIIFKVEGATAGTVKVESISGGPVAGIQNGESPILFDGDAGIYYADFSNMTIADDNPLGQKDYELVFKVTEEPSGSVSKYLVRVHIELLKPPVINIAGNLSVSKTTGEVAVEWVAIQGNNSTFGGIPGAMHEYDIRYQDYNEGTCSIATSFDTAKKPLETIAGPIPTPVIGEMNYDFFVNRIDNGVSGAGLKEADIHRNGNRYCFAVRAVDAVYASDGTVLAKNKGAVSPLDVGEVKMDWFEIQGDVSGNHQNIIRNIGDMDGDGFDDFVIADAYRSSDGTANDYAGHIQIFFSGGENSFAKAGLPDESLGQGVSSRADFNGDGYLDFAYTNVSGDVYIHYGTPAGISFAPSEHFVAKDGSTQYSRSMATGDYNGDGCDDIAISAPTVHGSGTQLGEVYIYFGRGETCFSNDPVDGNEPDVIYEGRSDNDRIGREIHSIGDVNGDGRTDFVFATISNIFVAYGGDPGGRISSYTITGLNSLPGRRVGYGDFNGDGYSDLVIGDNNKILIYYGKASGISAPASLTINDISPLNYSYPPSIANFARAVSHEMPDVNGDGLSDLIAASNRGLLVYYTIDGDLLTQPSIFDPFIATTSENLKVLLLNYGVVYCDNATHKGSCYFLTSGE